MSMNRLRMALAGVLSYLKGKDQGQRSAAGSDHDESESRVKLAQVAGIRGHYGLVGPAGADHHVRIGNVAGAACR